MKQERIGSIFLWVVTGAVLVYLIAPSLIVIPMSFSSSDILSFPPPDFSLRWYSNFLEREEWRAATRNSVIAALLTTVLATALGTSIAVGLVRERVPFRNAITSIFLAPMIVPGIVTAVAIYSLYARMHLVGTIRGLVLAHTIFALPYVIINVAAVLQGMDRRLEQAARSLGATPIQTFRLITFPLILPGILVGALFAFLTSFDELIIALFISGEGAATLPVRIWSGLRFEINPTVAAVSTMLIGLSLLLFGSIGLLRRRI